MVEKTDQELYQLYLATYSIVASGKELTFAEFESRSFAENVLMAMAAEDASQATPLRSYMNVSNRIGDLVPQTVMPSKPVKSN